MYLVVGRCRTLIYCALSGRFLIEKLLARAKGQPWRGEPYKRRAAPYEMRTSFARHNALKGHKIVGNMSCVKMRVIPGVLGLNG